MTTPFLILTILTLSHAACWFCGGWYRVARCEAERRAERERRAQLRKQLEHKEAIVAPMEPKPTAEPGDINVLALAKGPERYIFLYDDDSRAETLRVLGRFASNMELSFDWRDAAELSQKIREEAAARRKAGPRCDLERDGK